MQLSVESTVRKFIADSFLYREGLDDFGDDASFLDASLIDSTGILELVMFLEETFKFKIADAEVIPDNLDSINKIAAYVRRKTGATAIATTNAA